MDGNKVMVMELRNQRPHERVIVLDETFGRDDEDDVFSLLLLLLLRTRRNQGHVQWIPFPHVRGLDSIFNLYNL